MEQASASVRSSVAGWGSSRVRWAGARAGLQSSHLVYVSGLARCRARGLSGPASSRAFATVHVGASDHPPVLGLGSAFLDGYSCSAGRAGEVTMAVSRRCKVRTLLDEASRRNSLPKSSCAWQLISLDATLSDSLRQV
ncbi:hypothetical protein BD309DRAFT_965996 [Dichomitus squalens]|nr:hypothetical protein BD309DRAFT_965996 [Dichomitus squalens]